MVKIKVEIALRIQVNAKENIEKVEEEFEQFVSQNPRAEKFLDFDTYGNTKETDEQKEFITYYWFIRNERNLFDFEQQLQRWLNKTFLEMNEEESYVDGFHFIKVGEELNDIEEITEGYLKRFLNVKREIEF